MTQPSLGVNRLTSLQRQAIFVYLDLDVRLLMVCTRWKAEVHAALLSCWNHLPAQLSEAKKSVLATNSNADYFKLFALLNKYLSAELRQVDEESPKPFRTAFCGQLTPRRFVEMQKKIIAVQQARAFWERIRRQNHSLADIPSVSMMNKELTNPRRKSVYGKLNSLDLAEMGLDTIPSPVFLLAKLEHLDLSQNLLTELPDEILKLQNLVSINLSGNPLATDRSKEEALLHKLSQLPLLRKIQLNDKVIECVPAQTNTSPCGNCDCVVL